MAFRYVSIGGGWYKLVQAGDPNLYGSDNYYDRVISAKPLPDVARITELPSPKPAKFHQTLNQAPKNPKKGR